MDFKDFHIGSLINRRVAECGIEISCICNFLPCSAENVEKMYQSKSLDTQTLLRWSKLLEYDFFRIYSQHLVLYSPVSNLSVTPTLRKKKSSLPSFRKNLYTKEIIDFVLERISSNEMTKTQVIKRYRIPKTTLYKWLSKYS